MSNDYFSTYDQLPRSTLARAESVNAIIDLIVSGFDHLPAESELKQSRVTYAADAGATANAYEITPTYAIASYQAGQRFVIKTTRANTGPATLNVSAKGAVAIKRSGGADLSENDILSGIFEVVHNGTNFTLVSQHGAQETNAAGSATLAAAYAKKTDGYASGYDNSAKSWSVGGTGDGYPAAGPAKDWATKTGAAVASSEFSAKEYAQGTSATGGSAKQWAQTTGGQVASTDYSAKEHAIGSNTDFGSAKNWAIKTSASVIAGAYSAKEHAVGTQTRGVAGGGSAKDWASYTAGLVDDTEYSAKYRSLEAQSYAIKTDGYASGTDNSAKSWAIGGTGNGQPASGDAKSWATKTGSAVAGSDFSAREHAVGASVTTGSAKDWAEKTSAAVTTGSYSAKEWATGTQTRLASGGGSSKDWATRTGATVDDTEYSAKEHAQGAPATGSAKDWATKTASEVVAGQGYGAKKYAEDASLSATTALAVLSDKTSIFVKSDYSSVVFTKTGAGTVSIKANTTLGVAATAFTFSTATAVTMPTLTAGTDYAIYICNDGTVRADANFSYPTGYSASTSRKIGGFHYAPGGNATGTSGGDTTPAINPYSIWDLKWRPACPDPRGMALIGGGFWCDIYLCNTAPELNGTSAYNTTIADGSSPPKVPTAFGGNGSTAYSDLNWWSASEVMAAAGKQLLSYADFAAAMYGTTEGASYGTDPGSTVLREAYTSRWGIMLASGNMYVWGRDFSYYPGTGSAGWKDQAQSRGQIYLANDFGLVAALFGGSWSGGANAGSRASVWNYYPWNSDYSIGARGRCDHLRLA